MTPVYADLIGYSAGLINMVHLLPQLIKSHKTRSTGDISIVYAIWHVVGLLLWTLYGIVIQSNPVILMHAIEAMMAAYLVALKIRHG